MPVPLLIGSCEPFSGKSALALGLARQLAQQGVSLAFGKPLATCLEAEIRQPGDPLLDADVRFLGGTLGLPDTQLIPSLQSLDPDSQRQRLLAGHLDAGEGLAALQRQLEHYSDHLVLLGGWE